MISSISVLALLSGAFALPTPESLVSTGSFVVPVSKVKANSGSGHGLGKSRYATTSNAAAPLKAGINYDSYWFANITAGGEPLDVVLDTGSAVTWVLGPNSPSDQKAGQEIYDASKSSTSQSVQGETFSISYGDGRNQFAGPVYMDNLCVGNACTNAPIATADTMEGISAGTFRSGIMGLSFGADSQYTPTKLGTFFEALQKSLASPVFTCYFKQDDSGYIQFGATDASTYSGSLNTVTIDNSSGTWDQNSVSFYAGGKQLGGPIVMVFDTGSPNTYLPNATIANYHAQIEGSSYSTQYERWVFPCSSIPLPDFEFHFPNNVVGLITGANILLGTFDGGKTCTSWLISTDGRGSFGDPFFNTNVVVFNQKIPSVSFAQKK